MNIGGNWSPRRPASVLGSSGGDSGGSCGVFGVAGYHDHLLIYGFINMRSPFKGVDRTNLSNFPKCKFSRFSSVLVPETH